MDNPRSTKRRLATVILFGAAVLIQSIHTQAAAPTDKVNLIRQDLAERLGLPLKEITVSSSEEALWPDTCLGLPAPELCAQRQTPGYRIILEASGDGYVYHTDRTGEMYRFAGAAQRR